MKAQSVRMVAVCDKRQGLKLIYGLHTNEKVAALFHRPGKTTLERVEVRKLKKKEL